MKDQYFGDKRDYFKYDLMIFLAESLPGIQRFTFIPMLTKPDRLGHGRKTAYQQGRGNHTLYIFLQECISQERRSVARLRTFFGQCVPGPLYCPYCDEQYFTHQQRESYFAGIPNDHLANAVVLADPDNGLQVKTMRRSTGHRYIKYDETRDIYVRMSASSIFVIFQYFPREEREHCLRRLFRELESRVHCLSPTAIHDKEIAFITLAKSLEARERVVQQLREYKLRLENLHFID